MITFDCETKDPELEEYGPGVYRKDGYVVGISIKIDDMPSKYYAFAHPDTSEERRRQNRATVTRILGTNEDKLAANSQYDLDWLINYEGIPVNGRVHDVQIAEPLLDEYAYAYNLDALAIKYDIPVKAEDKMITYCEMHGWKGKPQSHIWEMPESVVAEYAEHDTDMTKAIFDKQYPKIVEQKLLRVYDMEVGLTPLLMLMRKNGIRVNRSKRTEVGALLRARLVDIKTELFKEYGAFNHNSTNDLAEIFDRLNLKYPYTPTGKPSIKKETLDAYDHPFCFKVRALREIDKIYSSFVMGAFLEYDIDGRIHCLFYPLKRDEGGTVSGRFSSQHPNLQQVPGKDEEDKGAFNFGEIIRDIFIAEEGYFIGDIDYSQIEYRTIAHYARGPKSDEVKRMYRENPKTDFHKLVQNWALDFGFTVDRGDAKRINFGFAYFMGPPAMSRKFNWPLEKAIQLSALYDRTMPFIKPTRTAVVNVAKGRGHIETILGRRARVSEEMRAERREYAMFNRLIQGTAADINKASMYKAYKDGLFNEGYLIPHITVHDELVNSVPMNHQGVEAYRELKHVMETTVELRVPIVAEAEYGPSWGKTKPVNWEELHAIYG